jgi:hypothetical protein
MCKKCSRLKLMPFLSSTESGNKVSSDNEKIALVLLSTQRTKRRGRSEYYVSGKRKKKVRERPMTLLIYRKKFNQSGVLNTNVVALGQ